MKLAPNLILVALLAIVVAGGAIKPAQGVAVAAPQKALPEGAGALDEGQLAPAAREVALPATVRRTLPRGAKTLFCVAARLEGRAVLLHGWNAVKGNTSLDILAATPARGAKSRTRRRTTSLPRLKRITVARIEPRQIVVRVLPLKANGRGAVIGLEWSQEQVAFAFTTVPMLVVVLPGGSGAAAITQYFSTESMAGNNTFYALHSARNGEAFLLLRDQSFDAQTQNLQRFSWNGRKFERQGEGITIPLPIND